MIIQGLESHLESRNVHADQILFFLQLVTKSLLDASQQGAQLLGVFNVIFVGLEDKVQDSGGELDANVIINEVLEVIEQVFHVLEMQELQTVLQIVQSDFIDLAQNILGN